MSQRTFAKALRFISQGKVTRLNNSDYFTKRYTVRGDTGFYSIELLNDGTAYCDCAYSQLNSQSSKCSHVIACELVETNLHTGENEMAYVKILAGGQATLTVQDFPPLAFAQHWVNNKGERCQGASCQYCAQGIQKNARYSHNVLNNGVTETWEFPQAVKDQLDKLAPNASQRIGTSFLIRRLGNNYVVDPANTAQGVSSPQNIHDYMMQIAPRATVTNITPPMPEFYGESAHDGTKPNVPGVPQGTQSIVFASEEQFTRMFQNAVADILLDDANVKFIKQRLGLETVPKTETTQSKVNAAFARFATKSAKQ